MKLTILFCIVVCFSAMAKVQDENISLSVTNAPLETIFKEIQKQTGYTFVFTKELLEKANNVSIELENATLNEALKQVFLNQPLSYTIYNKMVVIKDRDTISAVTTLETYAVIGTVSDEKGGTIPGATVFIANSKTATATDREGKFVLRQFSPGNYELIVNMIGFVPYRQNIKIQDRDINITVKLKESNTLLNAVTIKGVPKPKPDKRYLKIFTENFIGLSANALQCKILNPQVLNFQRPKGQYELDVNADDFLVIENDALGYKIKYLLRKFVYYFKYDVCYYDGSPYFEELQGTAQQQQLWENNRKLAYLGSARNFFRAAINGTSRAEGFYTYKINNEKNHRFPLKPVNIDSMLAIVNKNFKALIAKSVIPKQQDVSISDLYIYYIRAEDDQDQLTWVKQLADTIVVDKNGGITPGGCELFNAHSGISRNRGMTPNMAFSFWGRWAFQRIADLTPLDYFVEPVLDSTVLKLAGAPDEIRNKMLNEKLQSILPADSLNGRTSVYGIKMPPPAKPPETDQHNKIPPK